MRTALFALLLPVFVAGAEYRDIQKTAALNGNGSVTISTHRGSIDVSTWDRAEVEMKARIEAEPGVFFRDHRVFDATEVQFDSSANSIQIRTKYPEVSGCCTQFTENNPVVNYVIRMPRTAQLYIRDHRSETKITGMEGALDIETHRGSVRVDGLRGPLRLRTHRGNAEVRFAEVNGTTSIETHRGSVELSMNRNTPFNIDGRAGRHTSFGSDFPLPTRETGRRERTFRGAVNGGGSTIKFNTERGNIRLRAI